MSRAFRRVGLWARLADDSVAEPAIQIITQLHRHGMTVYAAPPADSQSRFGEVVAVGDQHIAPQVDLMIAIGGDGTMLHAAHEAARHQVPLLGVNRGRLGFLADVLPEKMHDVIDEILSGNYREEERLMLEARLVRDGTPTGESMIALNDVAVQKGDSGRMLDCVTWVDSTFVTAHRGDGLIVATPTGSTAYALSCGGPIMQPNVDALVIAPICPHTLSDRPLVLKADSVVEIQVQLTASARAHVSCDGDVLDEIGTDDRLSIRAAPQRLTLLHPPGYDYYELLRSKLNWGRANRSGREG